MLLLLFATQLRGEHEEPIRSSGNGAFKPHTLVFGSCNNAKKASIWADIERQSRPDGLILLGDTMYADHRKLGKFYATNESNLRLQYNLLLENRDFMSLVNSFGGIRSLSATFDDHDYGINNGDKTFPLRNYSQECFWDFLAEPKDSLRRMQSGVYSSKTVTLSEALHSFTYKIILLDSRSNKDPHGTDNGDFLGQEQWKWLESELADPVPNLILLGSSIQVLPDDKLLEETWAEFPQMRQRLLTMVANAAAPNVVFLSGDIHTGEILQHKCAWVDSSSNEQAVVGGTEQFRLFEFTSSGLSHTFTKTTPKANPDQALKPKSLQQSKGLLLEIVYDLYVATSVSHSREFRFNDHFKGLHYGLIEISPSISDKSKIDVTFSIIDVNGKAVISRVLPMKERSDRKGEISQKLQCQPFWGPVSKWRISLARISLIMIPIIFVGLPVAFSLVGIVRVLNIARRRLMQARTEVKGHVKCD